MNSECPPPDLPECWREIHADRQDRILRAAEEVDSGFYIDIFDISPAADLLTYQIRLSVDSNASPPIPITTVSDGAEATSILESLVMKTDLHLEECGHSDSDEFVTEVAAPYQPVNADPKRGHPAESLLEGYTIAIGEAPATVCPISEDVIWDSPTTTPRVTCYATGSSHLGWAPHAIFHQNADIEAVADVDKKYRVRAAKFDRGEVVISGLARTSSVQIGESDGSSETANVQELTLHQVAVLDED